MKKLEATVRDKKTAFETVSSSTSTYQKEVDNITEEINERMTGRIKVTDKNISEVAKSINKIKAEITRINVAVKTSERYRIYLIVNVGLILIILSHCFQH